MLEIFDEQKVDIFLEEIRKKYGYDFREYSRSSVNRRLFRFMEKNRIKRLEDLLEKVLKDPFLFEFFIQEFTITVTEMFRDPDFFMSLRKNVIPVLSTYPFIRIWDAGCATGEELYSLAILLREENLLHKATIYATDLNQRALEKAKEGIFDLSNIPAYAKNYRLSGGKAFFSDYYHSNYSAAIFDKTLKKNMVFYPHNLVTDHSFNDFHLIVCRNVLIYFRKRLQEKVFKLFTDSLVPLCFLGLGNKETIMLSSEASRYEVVNGTEKIFRYNGLKAG